MKKIIYLIIILPIIAYSLTFCDEEDVVEGSGLPDGLPFEFSRTDVGNPLSEDEITAFTKRITGAWKNADYFNWLRLIAHGIDQDNEEGMPYYSNWWTGVFYVKEGDKITFKHSNQHSSDNATLVQAGMLQDVISGYLLTGDETMAYITDELSRGISANIMCMEWDDNVPEEDKYLMARYIINNNWEKNLGDGRIIAVDYTEWREESTGVFSDTIHIPDNPYWGDIYAKVKRSKDDICHVFRMAAMLPFAFSAFPYEYINEAVEKMYSDLQSFARDIVINEYRIRTRDHDGNIYIPDADLASFMDYGLEAECTARLSAHLLGYGDTGGIDCGNGIVDWYESIATTSHMFNFDMIRNYHMSALLMCLLNEENDMAYTLMQGLAQRVDNEFGREYTDSSDQDTYDKDLAGNLVRMASCGLPLTSREVSFIHENYDIGIDIWNSWEYWDMWDESIPDGEYYFGWYNLYPQAHMWIEDMTNFMRLCASPYYNESGIDVVDCDIIKDPSQWGN